MEWGGGDRDTGGQLELAFARRYEPMVRLASWLTADPAAAEDVVQDAFVRLARVDLDTVDSIDAYLRTTVVNLCRSRQRRAGRARRLAATEAAAPDRPGVAGADGLLADEELAEAVARLPRRQRECVILRFTDDLAVADIAGTLGISEGSVKTHLHRALATLGRALIPGAAPEPTRRPR